MTLGYNEPRPTKEDYEKVVSEFELSLAKHMLPVSLYLHGSYITPHCTFGRSDVDQILVFPEQIVTDKLLFDEVSLLWSNARMLNPHVPLQVTPIDLESAKSGRLNSFQKSYAYFLKNKSQLVYGVDSIGDFIFEDKKSEYDGKISHQLRKLRLKYLDSLFLSTYDHVSYINSFDSALKSTSSMSRDVAYVFSQQISSRFSSFDILKKELPSVDFSSLEKIQFYFKDLTAYDKLFRRKDEVQSLWTNALTFSEELAKGYLEKTS